MGKPDPPPPPDYTGAAQAQGQANVEAARVQGKINNPNVINPYGTQTTTWGTPDEAAYTAALQKYQQDLTSWNALPNGFRPPAPSAPTQDQFIKNADQPTLTQTFSPQQQALYDSNVATQGMLGGLAQQGAQAAQGIVGKPFDFSGSPAAPGSAEATRSKVINAMMGRVNEDYGRQTDQANSDLVAAGIHPGSKAYDDRMQLLQRGRNDAAQQAYLAGGQEMSRDFQTDTQRRKDAIAELISQRQLPLNEITALMSGSQVSNPFAMPNYAQNAQVAPAPTFAATNAAGQYGTDVYNAQQAGQGNLASGMFGLGGSGLMALGMFA